MKESEIRIIAATGRRRELGKEGKLLWTIPDDLKRFKELTNGHPVIMGRKTFESILEHTGGKLLPGRTMVVMTRDPLWKHEGAITAASIEDAFAKARSLDSEAIFVIGGAQVYEQALPEASKLHLTLIDDEKEGDAFFPPYESEFAKKTFEESREWNGLSYKWVDLERA